MSNHDVRTRTLPVAFDPIEVSVNASLETLRAAAADLANAGEVHSDEVPGLALALADAARTLRQKWFRLKLQSPYVVVADEVIGLLDASISRVQPTGLFVSVGRELREWTRARWSRKVATQIQAAIRNSGLTLREAARRSGVAPGHMSELLAGQGALPTTTTARRLDDALGTDVVSMVAAARDVVATLGPGQRRSRRPLAPLSVPSSVDPRLDALLTRLAGDERLLQLNEDLLRLPAATRRALTHMVKTMVESAGR